MQFLNISINFPCPPPHFPHARLQLVSTPLTSPRALLPCFERLPFMLSMELYVCSLSHLAAVA